MVTSSVAKSLALPAYGYGDGYGFPASLLALRHLCWTRRALPISPSNAQISLDAKTQLLRPSTARNHAPQLPIKAAYDVGVYCVPGHASESHKDENHSSGEPARLGTPKDNDGTTSILTAGSSVGSCCDPVTEGCEVSKESNGPKEGFRVDRILHVHHPVSRHQDRHNVRWFPYMDEFRIKNVTLSSSEIREMLGTFMSEERRQRIERVVANRTYSICPVVEGLVDLGNISAVFRSADALGFQSVHVIANVTNKQYRKNRKVSMGSEKWLDAELWDTTRECLETMRLRGYRIAVANVADDTVSIFDIDWTIPTAVVFGNEVRGVSTDALHMADISCSIPMAGMVDSFNVSVAAGIVMHHAVCDRIAQLGKHGDLLSAEQSILSADFYLRHNSKSLSIIDHLLEKKKAGKQTSLTSVLRGELEVDIEMPEYLKAKIENVRP